MRGSLFFLTLLMLWAGCSSSKQDTFSRRGIQGALLASRFESFEDFKSVVEVSYSEEEGASVVRLHHCANGAEVVSILKSGLSQKDISNAQRGTFADRLHILFRSPYTISSRLELNEINLLAKRRTIFFGEGDVAFFDLALVTVDHINTKALAYKTARDSSEKGYLNTFNHFIAQAIITSCYSERLADFVADVHELKSMPELTHGGFSEDQLVDPNNNPVDNYVDMINNEWGQECGKFLKKKYHITHETVWTTRLLADYLNDAQVYLGCALQIGFEPYRPSDEVVIRFVDKLNNLSNQSF